METTSRSIEDWLNIAVQEGSGIDLAQAYDAFLNRRADMVMDRIEKLLTLGELS